MHIMITTMMIIITATTTPAVATKLLIAFIAVLKSLSHDGFRTAVIPMTAIPIMIIMMISIWHVFP